MINTMLNGLSVVNVELTSRCNKSCWMCGRRQLPNFEGEDMDISLVHNIASQLPPDIIVQLHDNGEPLLYPLLGEAFDAFKFQIKCLDTNGKLLVVKSEEIIGKLDTITISTFENDPEAELQYQILKEFIRLKGDKPPMVIVRTLGNVFPKRYEELGCLIAKRTIHSPNGSFNYRKERVIPEHGICLDMMSHLAIKANGNVAHCVRFDPEGKGIIGNLAESSLNRIWNGLIRKQYLDAHIAGKRADVPLCASCDYWGVPG